MRDRVVIYSKWLGELVSEGPEQSTIKVLEGGPASLRGEVICLPNTHFKKMKERKSSGPPEHRDYASPRAGVKTKEKLMSDESVENGSATPEQDTNYVQRYNELVEEAVSIGLTAKTISTRFRDQATGAKRCEALEAAIRSKRAEMEDSAAQPESAEAEEQPSPTQTRKRSKKVPKTSTAKKAVAKKAPAKKVAAKKVPAEKRNGVVGEFGTREGSFREGVLLALYAKKNKPVALGDVAKEVYGNKSDESRLKVKAVIVGLNMMINGQNPTGKKLPYEDVVYEGRGEEATVMLASKSGR